MLRVLSYDSLDACGHLRERVDALNLAARRPCPYSTFEYFENFIEHDEFFEEGKTARVLFLAVMDDDQLVGYVALRRRFILQLGREPAKVEWVTIRDTDRPHLVSAPQDEARCATAIVEHLVKREPHWSYLELADQEDDSPLTAAIERVVGLRYALHRVPGHQNATIPLIGHTAESYYKALSHNTRQKVSRAVRHLLAAGDVELIESDDAAAARELLRVHLEVEKSTWKARAGVGIGRHPKRIAFYEGLFDATAPLRLHVAVLTLNGEPMAGTIRGRFANVSHFIDQLYDDRFESLSPGRVLFFLTLMGEIAAGVDAFNLRNDSAYWKQDFLASTVSTSHVRLYRRGSLAYLQGLAGNLRRWVRRGHEGGRYNPVKREVSVSPEATSNHPAESIAAGMLREVIASGVSLTRLDGEQLAARCPWKRKKVAAGHSA